jgi:hypothetical protein
VYKIGPRRVAQLLVLLGGNPMNPSFDGGDDYYWDEAYYEDAAAHEQQLHEEYLNNIQYFDDNIFNGSIEIRKDFHQRLSEHPPFYPYNTFALRENNCHLCHAKVYAPGWYFRFLQKYSDFSCLNCREKHYVDKYHGRQFQKIKKQIEFKIGNEIIEMLQSVALTN